MTIEFLSNTPVFAERALSSKSNLEFQTSSQLTVFSSLQEQGQGGMEIGQAKQKLEPK